MMKIRVVITFIIAQAALAREHAGRWSADIATQQIELSDATGTWGHKGCPTYYKYYPLKLKQKHEE